MATFYEITPTTTLEDLTFTGRNKEYGAYDLRKRYTRYALISTVLGIALIVAFFGAQMLLDRFSPAEEEVEVKLANMSELPPPPEQPNQPPPPPPPRWGRS